MSGLGGTRMGWWVPWLVWFVLLGGLALFNGGSRRRRVAADDTLITESLAPPQSPDMRVKPGPGAQQEVEVSAAHAGLPAPRTREEGAAPSAVAILPALRAGEAVTAPGALPSREDTWLETQLAWIQAWAQVMQEQIALWATGPEDGRLETQLASITASSEHAEEQIASELAAYRSSSQRAQELEATPGGPGPRRSTRTACAPWPPA